MSTVLPSIRPPSASPSPSRSPSPSPIPTTITTSDSFSTTCPRLLFLLSEILLIFQRIATLANIRILITTALTNHSDIHNTEVAIPETDPIIQNITFMICDPIPEQEFKTRILCARGDVFFPTTGGIRYAHQGRHLHLTFISSQFGLPDPHPAHEDWSQFPSAATLIRDLKPGTLPTLAPRDQVIWQVYFCGLGGHDNDRNKADANIAWDCLARVGGLLPVKWAEWEVDSLML
ncbi:hypothetical protein BO94DRAFT_538157, partial [Aspergillus sclerotioniger CBS 115572]